MMSVRATFLKYITPLEERKLISGADNASAKVIKTMKVSDCLGNILNETAKDEPDLPGAVARIVEMSGLNADKQNLV